MLNLDEMPFITEEVLESENEAYQRAVGFYAKFFNVSEEEAREYVELVDALKEEKVGHTYQENQGADGFWFFTKCWYTYTKKKDKKLGIFGYVVWAINDFNKMDAKFEKLKGH